MPSPINTGTTTGIANVTGPDDSAGASTVALPCEPAPAARTGPGPLAALQALGRPRRRQRQAAFEDLGTNVIERIADKFPKGSKDTSRLCTVSRTLRADLSERAFADKLCAQAAQPLAQAHVSDAFEQAIAHSMQLPLSLRADVLAAVLLHLPRHLHAPLPGLERLLDALLQVSKTIQKPEVRCDLYLRLGANFKTVGFRSQCFDLGDVAVLKPAMAGFYETFRLALHDALSACAAAKRDWSAAVGPIDSDQPGTAAKPPVSASAEIRKMYSIAFRTLARGLFMVGDDEDRHSEWCRMQGDPRCGTGDERLALIKGLGDELLVLPNSRRRHNAFSLLLDDVSRLSAEAQPEGIWRLAQRLNALSADSASATMLGRLSSLALALPPDVACEAMCNIVDVIPGILPVHRRDIAFGSCLDAIRERPPADRTRIFPVLASRIFCLPEGASRVAAFDALWNELQLLEVPLQAAAVCRLVEDFSCLPLDPEVRQVRLLDVIDFARSLAPEQRFDLILCLADQVDALLAPDLQMSTFHNVLDLVTNQPQHEQPELLREMHDHFNFENFDAAVDDTTRFAMSTALGWAAARLPPQEHADLLVAMTDAAVWSRHPFMGRQFRAVVDAARRLPPQLGRDTVDNVAETLEQQVSKLPTMETDDIPFSLLDLLDTADRLPDAMRIRLLQQIVRAVPQLPASQQAAARAEIQQHLRGLSNRSLASLLTVSEAL